VCCDYLYGASSFTQVLVAALSEDPSLRLLLLEARPEGTQHGIRIPAILSTLFGTEVDRDNRLEQQAHHDGSTPFRRGKTLDTLGRTMLPAMRQKRCHSYG
jgi:choline dehydrogenase